MKMSKHPEVTNFNMSVDEFARYFDHSFLRGWATEKDLDDFVADMKEFHIKFCSANSMWIAPLVKRFKGTDLRCGGAISWPIGKNSMEIKEAELELTLKQGASYYDVVLDIGNIRLHHWDSVRKELDILQKIAAKYDHAPGRAIIETCYLYDEELVKVAQIAVEAGMDYVKTSSGGALPPYKNNQETSLATPREVRLLKDTVGPDVGVKTAGAVRSYESAIEFLKAGSDRLGVDIAPKLIIDHAKAIGASPPATTWRYKAGFTEI
jgi:deoxyribose-phosphate aldolase